MRLTLGQRQLHPLLPLLPLPLPRLLLLPLLPLMTTQQQVSAKVLHQLSLTPQRLLLAPLMPQRTMTVQKQAPAKALQQLPLPLPHLLLTVHWHPPTKAAHQLPLPPLRLLLVLLVAVQQQAHAHALPQLLPQARMPNTAPQCEATPHAVLVALPPLGLLLLGLLLPAVHADPPPGLRMMRIRLLPYQKCLHHAWQGCS